MMPMVQTWTKGMIPFKDWPQEIHPERLWVLQQVGPPEGQVILDLGCGRHKTLPEAIGVDVEPVSDVCCSLDYLPVFETGKSDIIISRHSIEHVLDPIATLQEWLRVLKPSGKVVIVLPDHEQVDTMQPILSGGLHLHAYNMTSFRNLIESTGMFKTLKLEVVIEDWSFGAVLVPR
jgi:predicted SAM-dependent methyltransferase